MPSFLSRSRATLAARSLQRSKDRTLSQFHRFSPSHKTLLGFDPETDPTKPFVVLVDVTYTIGPLVLKAHEGMRTDLASVPRLLRNIPGFAPTDGTWRAALFHDLGYKEQVLPRKIVDALYEDCLYDLGEPWFIWKLHYLGVRLCGWKPWKDNAAALGVKTLRTH